MPGNYIMKRIIMLYVIFTALLINATNTSAENITTSWGGKAGISYDDGSMYMVRKSADGAVTLFDMELIENDSPGFRENPSPDYDFAVWGDRRARKVITLDSPAAGKAFLVMATRYRSGKYPLKASINGHEFVLEDWRSEKNIEWCRWVEFPAEWLRKGDNTIDLYCPEAGSGKEGWRLMISRADMFAEGGGDPAHAGDTSYASFDNGRKWIKGSFGTDKNLRAELAIMLNLDRFVASGWLASPVIDLWKGNDEQVLVPQREIQRLIITADADIPDGTAIEYYMRKGTNPQPFSTEWEPYELIGNGPSLVYETGGADLNRRYVQVKAVLTTGNPIVSPAIRSLQLEAKLIERVPPHENIRVVEADNPPVWYPSVLWQWESYDRPELMEIRQRLNLDELTANCRTELEAQVHVLDAVSKRWLHTTPWPDFPAPDALSVLDRVESAGGGGYCSQFAHTLVGACLACGWQARIVNLVGHAVVEVWNNDYGKWIFIDADHVNHYNYDVETGEPLDSLELHRHYLDYYYPGQRIAWMPDGIGWTELRDDMPPPVKRGSLTHHEGTLLTGFINAGFIRMVTRNNWFEHPTPIPLIHGSSYSNPLNGYIHWYDDQTPPKRNYSWYTDRPKDMWFDLNTVHIDAVTGFGNDRVYLRFETNTPHFSNFEVNVDDTGWKRISDRWTWLLQSGRNTVRVRAVNQAGVKGKPSSITVNHADAQLGE